MRALALLVLLGTSAVACNDRQAAEDEIRANVTVVAHHEGQPVELAVKHLQSHGRAALPMLEAALHTAPVPGRKNLIMAIRRIGDDDAVALLRHFAIHDGDEGVRREAVWTLKQWAIESNPRGEKSRAALRAIDEERQNEEPG